LMPRISRAVFHLLPLPRSPELALALAQLRAAPGQAAVSLAAIVASFALMAAMAIMVASFRQSVDDWLGTVLPAEVYFRTTHAGDTGFLEPAFVQRVRDLPQIARIDFLRSGRVILDPARPPIVLIARDRAALAFPVVKRMSTPRSPAIWVSEAVHDIYGYEPGDVVDLPLFGRDHRVTVAGVFRDYARQHGAILIDRSEYVALTGDERVNDAGIWLKPGATRAAVMEALRALPGGTAISLVLVYVVNRQSFNWTIDLHPPFALLGWLIGILVALAVVTAIVSGREAMGMGPVRAVREDW